MTERATFAAVSPGNAVSNVRRYYELVDAGDLEGLVELFTEDAEYRRPGYPPLVGRAELLYFYQEDRIIKEGKHDICTVIVQNSNIAVSGGFSGVVKGGRKVEFRFADFFTATSDGLFASRETFFFVPLA